MSKCMPITAVFTGFDIFFLTPLHQIKYRELPRSPRSALAPVPTPPPPSGHTRRTGYLEIEHYTPIYPDLTSCGVLTSRYSGARVTGR